MIYTDTITLALATTGLTGLVALTVYLALHEFLHKRYAGRLSRRGIYREEIVMCGMDYEENTISIPITRVFVDIMRRSLPKIHYGIEKGIGTRILNDWFTWMVVLLATMIILALVLGW